MQRTKNIRGEGTHCGAPFSFPAESIGLTATCPHCGKETELRLVIPELEPALSRKALILGIVTIVILIVGLLGSLVALNRAKRIVKDQKEQRPAVTNAAR